MPHGGVFGFGPGKQEDLGEVAPTACPNCHNQVFLHHVQSKKSVRLHLVPVVPYGTDHYLECPICSRGLQVDKVQLPYVRSMSRAAASFRAGRLAEAQFLAQVERFWRQLGRQGPGQRPGPAAGQAVPPNAAMLHRGSTKRRCADGRQSRRGHRPGRHRAPGERVLLGRHRGPVPMFYWCGAAVLSTKLP